MVAPASALSETDWALLYTPEFGVAVALAGATVSLSIVLVAPVVVPPPERVYVPASVILPPD